MLQRLPIHKTLPIHLLGRFPPSLLRRLGVRRRRHRRRLLRHQRFPQRLSASQPQHRRLDDRARRLSSTSSSSSSSSKLIDIASSNTAGIIAGGAARPPLTAFLAALVFALARARAAPSRPRPAILPLPPPPRASSPLPPSSRRAVHSRASPRTLSTARRRASRARDARADHRRRRRHLYRFFLSTLLARVVAVVSLAPLSRGTRLRTRARHVDAPRGRARALGHSTRARVDPRRVDVCGRVTRLGYV